MNRYFSLFIAFFIFSNVAIADPFAPVKIDKINDRVYALLGPIDVPNKHNSGYVNNNLVIIGNTSVILVDAGSHKAVAEHIKEAIEKITSKPVKHVLITHNHPDHHLGLIAFPDIQVISSEYCAKQIAENGKNMVGFMTRNTGWNLSSSKPVTPQITVPQKTRRPMEIDGVKLELITTDTAHTEGDMMVWLPEDGVLASGDILVHKINPNFVDGNLKSWIGVVDEILKLPLKTVMPGHGALMQRQDIVEFKSLISSFYKTIEDIYKAGGSEADVRKKLDLARWQQMARYDDMMGNNISKVWLQVEADNF